MNNLMHLPFFFFTDCFFLIIFSPNLRWRDIQYLIIQTSTLETLKNNNRTIVNTAGYRGLKFSFASFFLLFFNGVSFNYFVCNISCLCLKRALIWNYRRVQRPTFSLLNKAWFLLLKYQFHNNFENEALKQSIYAVRLVLFFTLFRAWYIISIAQ